MPEQRFRFKQFSIEQDRCAMKVGTDGVTLGAWTETHGAKRILDIGTGTGLLALMMAQRVPEAQIDAVEIDEAAAEQASVNITASPWAERIRVHWMDARRLHTKEPYDLIICNPPYYMGEMAAPDPRLTVAKHGAELTFDQLVDVVDKLLADRGRFAVIVPSDGEHRLRLAGERVGLSVFRRGPLWYLEGRPFKRVLLELWRGAPQDPHDPVIVERAPGEYTEAYKQLLAPFLLKF
ncbi:MAG: methyltransferase [Flavobacteriales bacterium]|nr:methyltransferase [Flavobacteriales bacterium]